MQVMEKQGYKETELGWIPEDWKVVKLGEYTKSFAGGTPSRANPEFYKNGTISWVKSTEVNQDKIYFTEEYITEKALSLSSAKIINPNSVLIAMYGATAGQVSKLMIEATSNQAVLAINSINDNLINDFIYFYLKANKANILGVCQGSGQPNLSKGIIDSLKIPLPKIKEQQKIAEILSTVDEKIDHIDKQIEQAEQLKKGLMQELLTKGIGHTEFKDSEIGRVPEEWEAKTVGQVAKFSGGSQPPRNTFIFEPKEGYIRLIQIRDYKSDKYATYVPKELTKKFCSNDDIMIGRYGPPIFQILRGLEGAYNVALIKAIPEKCVYKEYLYYFLKQETLFKYIEGLSTRSCGQTGVEMDRLKDYPFPLPPIPEQQEIAKIINTVDEKLETLQNKKSEYENLKKGLMQKLLTGQIRVSVQETQKQPKLKIIQGQKETAEHKTVQPAFKRAVLAAEITAQLYQEPTFGSVKQEKLIFLCETHAEITDIDRKNYRKAAGPYDPSSKRSIYSNFKKLKWFNVIKQNGATKYPPAENFGNHKKYFDRYFSEQAQEIQRIINLFRTEYTQTCEIVATLYGVWNDFIIDGKNFNDNDIINEVLNNWHDEKKKIERWKWQKGLEFIRINDLIPTGKGQKTLITV